MHDLDSTARQAQTSPLPEQVFAALYHGDQRPRARWTRLVRHRLGDHQLRARGSGLVDEVFEHLATGYVVDALTRPLPVEMAIGAWLHKRFTWDAYRAAERIMRSAGVLREGAEADDHAAEPFPVSPEDAFDAAAASLMGECIAGMVQRLPPKERHAVAVRLLCGMSSVEAHELLGLPPASRARANHNQAFKTGIEKLREALAREGWTELQQA